MFSQLPHDPVCFVFIDMMLQKGEKKEIYAENQLKQAYLLKRTCKTRDLTAEKFKYAAQLNHLTFREGNSGFAETRPNTSHEPNPQHHSKA